MLSCDIVVNTKLAIYNTELIKSYSSADDRIVKLGLIVKYWAKRRRINEPFFGTLSSYCYMLMLIHFLQLRPVPVLPNLQECEKTLDVDGCNVSFISCPSFKSANNESLADLLMSFFKYYAYEFNYKDSVVSIRCGKVISKGSKQWNIPFSFLAQEKYWFCVEDPFDITYNLARAVTRPSLYLLRGEFIRAYQLISHHCTLSIICSEAS